MKSRRITLGLSAVGGGLLAAAFLPMAVANADTADYTAPVTASPDAFGFEAIPGSPETILTISGYPPLYQQVEGYQTFDYVTPRGDDLGSFSFNADVSTLTTPGFENTEYLITGPGSSPIGVANADLSIAPTEGFPTEGSVYDIANFGNGFENVYSDVLSEPFQRLTTDATADSLTGTGTAATGTITDTLVTPFGNIDLTPLVDGFSTAVTGGDFLTTVDPSLIDDLGSILGSFGDVLKAF